MISDDNLRMFIHMTEEEARERMSSTFGLHGELLDQSVIGLNAMREIVTELLLFRQEHDMTGGIRPVYECTVTLNHRSLDDDNRWRNDPETDVLVSEDIDLLYQRLGEAKTQETPPDEVFCYYTNDVEFSTIRQIIVISKDGVDQSRLMSTVAMQQHQEKLREKKAAADAIVAAKESEKEVKEKAELARLLEKYHQ